LGAGNSKQSVGASLGESDGLALGEKEGILEGIELKVGT